ncbi:transglycosylase family protein [Saccharopolyspora griseoalba]|uniref:Transglycosylase family protein n=1 Tax=Saccharopolyspora griseoalba TaxID=1431848 RepID=A0ABW2LFG2_9PSEU
MSSHKGKHRKPSNTKRNFARFAVAGAVVATPIAIAAPANAADWDMLAQCESSGDWSTNTGNGFYGGLQFTPSTWSAYGGTQYASSAHLATREQQIAVAEKVLASQGENAWPACSSKLNWTSGSTDTSSEASTSQQSTETETETQSSPVKASGGDYTVKAGDTLSKIAQSYGVDYKSIFNNNTDVLTDPNMIFPGQQLDIR